MKQHKWCLKLEDGFRDQYAKLDRKTRNFGFRILRQVLEADNPLSLPKVRKIVNADEVYRIRIGNYRLFFQLEVGEVFCEKFTHKGIVRLVSILDRKDAYRNL